MIKKSLQIIIVNLFLFSTLNVFSQNLNLSNAIVKNDLQSVETILKTGTNINKADKFGNYPIFIAMYNSNIEMIKLLFQYGADLSQKDKMNNTLLMVAAYKNNIEIVQYLLDQGAEVDERGGEGKNALMFCCLYDGPLNNIEIIKLLVRYGSDVNFKDFKNHTALELTNKKEIIEYLNGMGARKGSE
ncbi:MAG: ankyrin repeat domain-containing protein [Bacteroidetes bacterium]|nr:ankyrin repeat domain-containing protein [Bacteroidota bacterium]